MLINERQAAVLQELHTRKVWSIRDLKEKLRIPSATLHRDLAKLEDSGLIARGHGNVALAEAKKPEHFLESRRARSREEKIEIARKTIGFIKDETSIFLDHSSTCTYLARAIRENRYRHLVLVTNSLAIASELEGTESIDVVLAGGDLEHAWSATKGPHALDLISKFNFDQAFVSCGMISAERGARTNYSFVAEIARTACDAALESNLLVDSSKFIKAGAHLIRKASAFTRIITDRKIAPEAARSLRKLGVELVV